MYIKICGVTNSEDADYAIACGATHIGLIFAEQSKRVVTPIAARQITTDIAKRAIVVGVFQNNPLPFVQEVREFAKLNIVQLHGNEDPTFCSQVSGPVMKALAIGSAGEGGESGESGQETDDVRGRYSDWLLDSIERYRMVAPYLLFDKPKGLLDDGWLEKTLLRLSGIQDQLPPYFFAGGLQAANLATVFSRIRPYGVDVASGVEASPRKKDPDLIADFCARVRAQSGGWVDQVLLKEAASYLPEATAEEEKKAIQQLLSRSSKEEAK